MTDKAEKILKMIPIASILWKGGTQARIKGIDVIVVKEYAELMRSGVEFPPIVVFFDGEKYWPADGFHRGAAAHSIGETTIHAEIKRGSKRDALIYGIGLNRKHGLRLSNEDKRNAVRMVLIDDVCASTMSDRAIARECGVDHKTVGRIREVVEQEKQKRSGR